jgi:methylated-DNA-[protein]-cysteine S-methyltransferase
MRATELKRLTRNADDRSRTAAARFAEAAVADGAADVTYGYADSPFGPLLVAVGRRGLILLEYPGGDVDAALGAVAARVSPRILESAAGTDAIRRELDEYFDGRRRRFTVRPDLSLVRGFSRSVLERTARVPYGSVTTYGRMAALAGSPRAARATGNALGSNPIPIVVPCHRVVHADGGLGGYTGGIERKVTLLRLEGALDEATSG